MYGHIDNSKIVAAFRGMHMSPVKHSYAWLPRQANSKNRGPPPGNKFDLEIGQRSRSRSQYGTNRKGLSQWSFIPNINAVSFKLQKIWARLKFLWQTETDGQTDEWDLMSPAFPKGGGQKCDYRTDRHRRKWSLCAYMLRRRRRN